MSKPHITTASRNIIIGSGPSNEGTWHRAVMVAKALHDAGRWDGEATLTLHDPYRLHQRMFGIERIPASALIESQDFEIYERTKRMNTSRRPKNGPFGTPHTKPGDAPPAKAILCAKCGQERPNTSDDCPHCGDGSHILIKRINTAADPDELRQEINADAAPKYLRPNIVTTSPANADEKWSSRTTWRTHDKQIAAFCTITHYDDGTVWVRGRANGNQDLIFGQGRSAREAYRDFCRKKRLAKHDVADLLRERKQLRNAFMISEDLRATALSERNAAQREAADAQRQINAVTTWLDAHNIPAGSSITNRLTHVHFQLMALQKTVTARQDAPQQEAASDA